MGTDDESKRKGRNKMKSRKRKETRCIRGREEERKGKSDCVHILTRNRKMRSRGKFEKNKESKVHI